MSRKTVKVQDLVILANQMNFESVQQNGEGRIAISVLLEHVLMESGNYHGFRYNDGANGDIDDTRRQYYGVSS